MAGSTVGGLNVFNQQEPNMGRKLEGRAAMVLTENRVHRGTPQEARDSDTGHFFKVGG